MIEDFSFEAFHLIDSLLYQADSCVDSQLVSDAESALWTLEQVLCYAPELVGKGLIKVIFCAKILKVGNEMQLKLFYDERFCPEII